jgi:hypothetical protein
MGRGQPWGHRPALVPPFELAAAPEPFMALCVVQRFRCIVVCGLATLGCVERAGSGINENDIPAHGRQSVCTLAFFEGLHAVLVFGTQVDGGFAVHVDLISVEALFLRPDSAFVAPVAVGSNHRFAPVRTDWLGKGARVATVATASS